MRIQYEPATRKVFDGDFQFRNGEWRSASLVELGRGDRRDWETLRAEDPRDEYYVTTPTMNVTRAVCPASRTEEDPSSSLY